MPLIRRGPSDGVPDNGRPDLASGDPAERRRAVRALPRDPASVAVLMALLGTETDAAVREAVFTSLAAIPEAAPSLAGLLRSQDAGLRNGAVEALQAMPGAVLPLLPELLADRDADVRLLAVEITRCLPADDATGSLCGLLDRETDANVCVAALEILAEVGTPDAAPAMRRLAGRFPGEPIVPFAVNAAIRRVTGGRA
ncbi:hypothetical protein N825_25525 [Skermanella stibiiresistens SB22]|uniref:PBS lyase n=1 Tax=Skermanella stibiiresistens SB22 TaxID=1385369 RepID=W9GZ87_9PROT|nr:HEAT repeat domain-containing protein [Skermanella stibiiresistens]EWY36798.1 hypothetical protein N825_25525 [Skermanella stibiiresistens SB22]